jgi:hypothetical protein
MSTPTVTRYTFFSVYYGGKLSVESMFNFLVEEKYPNAHFFVDEVPFEWISKVICCFKKKPEVYTWLAISPEIGRNPLKKSVLEDLVMKTSGQEVLDKEILVQEVAKRPPYCRAGTTVGAKKVFCKC